MTHPTLVPNSGPARRAVRDNLLPGLILLSLSAIASGQTNPTSEAPVELSPFLVSSEGDQGYRAANTLAGTRMNTSLFMTPAAISVLTKELLDDLGAEKTEDFLRFAVSTDFDVGSDANGNNSQWYDAPAKIRGFGGATVTRDYFPWGLSADIFNVERVDLNRGPNAVLYGVGAPGGMINTSSKQAKLNGAQKSVSLTFGSWDKKRSELDLALPLIKDKLAARVNTVIEDKNGWRDFESFKQKGIGLAATYRPLRNTVLRGGYERMIREQLVPLGTVDDLGGLRWLANGAPRAAEVLPGTNPAPSLLRARNIEQVMYAPQLRAQPFRMSTIGGDMRPDIAGVQPSGFWDTLPGAGTLAQGNVDDPYLGKLIPLNVNPSGPGGTTNNDYSVYSFFVEQRIGNLFIEAGYRHRKYWRDNRSVGVSGLIGDPNPVIPGAYQADGDSRVAAGRAPGTLLPDIAAPNPHDGGVYVEGTAQTRPFDEESDHYRVNLGYELDLTRQHRWLGRHAFSALWQQDKNLSGTWVWREFNLTPNNNQPIDAVTNTIIRRTYLDFTTPGGLRGALDPWANPIVAPGVKSGFAYTGPGGPRKVEDESRMIAGQSRFLDDRLVLTGGYREDVRLDSRTVAGGERLPNSTNLWTKLHDQYGPTDKFKGETTTFGVFFSPFKRIGLTYNQANSVLPQSPPNPYNQLYGTRVGRGKDYGLRINLLADALYFNVNGYTTDDTNRQTNVFVQQQLGMNQAIPAILETSLRLGRPLPASMVAAGVEVWSGGNGHTVDTEGEGIEFELVGRLAKNWSVSLNYGYNKQSDTNIAPFHNAFFAETKAAWDGNMTPLDLTPANVQSFVRTRDGTPGRDFVLEPATINDAYDYASLLMAEINRANGQQQLRHLTDSINFFTSYRFMDRGGPVFRGARIGGGANYRSAPVIGYDGANNDAPIMGAKSFMVNIMLGKTFQLGRGRTFDLQLNVQNLFGEEDMIPFQARAPGQFIVYNYPRLRRSWDLKASYRF